MTFKKLIAGVFAFALLPAAMVPIETVAQEQIELRMQFASPDGTPWNDMDRRFAAQIEDITDGRATVSFFPPNSVTPFNDWLQATGAGILDLGFVWHPVLPGKFLQMDLMSLPGLGKNQTIDSVVYWRLRDEFPAMGELFTPEDNVVELATFVAMGSHLHTSEPVRTLEDMRGKVYAAQDASGVKVLERLGASATVMVGSDAYLALQRGAVDGVLCAWGWVNNFNLNEVTTYHTLLNLNPGTYSSVMNKDTFNRFTPEEQARLQDIDPPMYFLYNTTDGAAQAMSAIPEENIFELSADDRAALQEQMRPLWDEWVETADSAGLEGQAILDRAIHLLDLYDRN